MSTSVRVDPFLLVADGETVSSLSGDITTSWSSLASTLRSSQGMAGDDESAEVWAPNYDTIAQNMGVHLTNVVSGLRGLDSILTGTGATYDQAELNGVDGSPSSITVSDPAPFTPGNIPTSLGTGLPGTLGEVQEVIEGFLSSAGIVFPRGDTAKLRSVAGDWRTFETEISIARSSLSSALTGVAASELPQMTKITQAQSTIDDLLKDAETTASDAAEALDAAATQIDATWEELSELGKQLAIELAIDVGITVALSVVTFGLGAVAGAAKTTHTILKWVDRIADAIRRLKAIQRIPADKLLSAANKLRMLTKGPLKVRIAFEVAKGTVASVGATVIVKGDDLTAPELFGALAGGFVGSAGGSVLGAGAQRLLRGSGAASSTLTTIAREAVTGAGSGAGGSVVGSLADSLVQGTDFNIRQALLLGGLGGGVGGGLGGGVSHVVDTSTTTTTPGNGGTPTPGGSSAGGSGNAGAGNGGTPTAPSIDPSGSAPGGSDGSSTPPPGGTPPVSETPVSSTPETPTSTPEAPVSTPESPTSSTPEAPVSTPEAPVSTPEAPVDNGGPGTDSPVSEGGGTPAPIGGKPGGSTPIDSGDGAPGTDVPATPEQSNPGDTPADGTTDGAPKQETTPSEEPKAPEDPTEPSTESPEADTPEALESPTDPVGDSGDGVPSAADVLDGINNAELPVLPTSLPMDVPPVDTSMDGATGAEGDGTPEVDGSPASDNTPDDSSAGEDTTPQDSNEGDSGAGESDGPGLERPEPGDGWASGSVATEPVASDSGRTFDPDHIVRENSIASTGEPNPALFGTNFEPNTRYELDGGRFIFETDAQGRVDFAQGHLDRIVDSPDDYRVGGEQTRAGGPDRVRNGWQGDAGGHFFAALFGGPGEGINLTAQNHPVTNNGAYRALERTWEAAVRQGGVVDVIVRPSYPGDSLRPESYTVEYAIDGEWMPELSIPNPIPVRN